MKNSNLLALFSALFGCILFLIPQCAHAVVSDMVTQANQVSQQVAVVPKFAAMLSYVIGVIFAFRGLLALRRFIDNADENPITHVLGYLIVSAFLIALPYIITISKNSLGVQSATVVSSSINFADKGFGR